MLPRIVLSPVFSSSCLSLSLYLVPHHLVVASFFFDHVLSVVIFFTTIRPRVKRQTPFRGGRAKQRGCGSKEHGRGSNKNIGGSGNASRDQAGMSGKVQISQQ